MEEVRRRLILDQDPRHRTGSSATSGRLLLHSGNKEASVSINKVSVAVEAMYKGASDKY